MKLNDLVGAATGKDAAKEWEDRGYQVPKYDRETVRKNTLEAPEWIHFGAGNIFRAFPAADLDGILNRGEYSKGVIVAEGFDHDIIRKAYKPYNDMSLLVVLKADASIEKRVIGSVVASYESNPANAQDTEALAKMFEIPSLRMVSFTITEKGYALPKNAEGVYAPFVQKDLEAGPDAAKVSTTMGQITMYLYRRFLAGQYPIAMCSMDNCSHNGDKLKAAVTTIAAEWCGRGMVPEEFCGYLDSEKVTFPLSMIDKITPRPDDSVRAKLAEDGFEDTDIIITDKNTYTAPFVNAEETQYLVMEDKFPNGRVPLEKAGVIFTDRETVDKCEKMKVCTCLNPLHTALAVFGCLLGHTSIHEEMKDEVLAKLVTRLGYEEGMPVVVDPGVLSPKDFIQAVLTQRLVNPFMPDTPQRIATDTSQKLPIRFGETLKAYDAEGKDLNELNLIPLVIAGYMRYLTGIDDECTTFVPSPDPLYDALKEYVLKDDLNGLLARADVFGINLVEKKLSEKIIKIYRKMSVSRPGSIRETLNEMVMEKN